jgi:hypothetical protein
MQRSQVPDIESYEQREDWRQLTYRTAWPISSPPDEWLRSGEPTIQPGDLVGWIKHPDADLKEGWYTPAFRDKHVGLVLMTRWILADWMRFDGKAATLVPEACILWGDGDVTNTSHSCLKVFNREESR